MKYTEIAEQSAIAVYGENRVDTNHEERIMVIRFPEFTIRNRMNKSHIIRDLFVKLELDNEYIKFSGLRRTMTEAELISGYSHSHLPSFSHRGSFAGFCLGSSELRLMTQEDLQVEDHDWWEMVFYTLESMLTYESIEGGPYIRMSRVSSLSRNLKSLPYGQFSRAVAPVFSEVKFDGCKVTYKNGIYQFDTRSIEKRIIEKYESYTGHNPLRFAVVGRIEGTNVYVDLSSTEALMWDPARATKFEFKGEEFPFTVFKDDTEDVNYELAVHPYVLNYIKSRLNNVLNQQAKQMRVSYSETRREGKDTNKERVTDSNSLSASEVR